MQLSVIERNEAVQTNLTINKFAYSVEEIAERTSLSKAFLRGEIKRGQLKATRFGARILVLTEDLDSYLKIGSSGNKQPAIAA